MKRSLILIALTLAACAAPAPTPTEIIPVTGLTARVADMAGEVTGRVAAGAPIVPVNVGFQLNPGGQVQTGDASRARVDFSDGSILRLGENAAFNMKGTETAGDGTLTTRLQLILGKMWVSLAGGAVEVETPVGVASVRGSFAVLKYEQNQLQLDCLEGSCAVQNNQGLQQLGNLERLILATDSSKKEKLTEADVLQFVADNPESIGLVATLTAAPPATDTPTREATPTHPATATQTEATTAVTATATETATATSPPTATNTVRPNFAIIGTHVVRGGETLNCIGRAYGVLPSAIASANDISLSTPLAVDQALRIPAVQWQAITPGAVCAPQFTSPFPGLLTATGVATHTSTATSTITASATRPSPPATAMATATLPPTETATLTATVADTATATATSTTDPTQGFGWSVSNVSLNGGGNSITVSPGGQFRVQLDYQVWNAVSCPSCIAQIVIDLSNGARYCAYDSIPGVYPGALGTNTITLNAPDVPGAYTLQAGFDLQFSCADAMNRFTGGTVIGTVTVQ
jgi:hypothetical protein